MHTTTSRRIKDYGKGKAAFGPVVSDPIAVVKQVHRDHSKSPRAVFPVNPFQHGLFHCAGWAVDSPKIQYDNLPAKRRKTETSTRYICQKHIIGRAWCTIKSEIPAA
jgi:hypothetical protein